MRASGEALEYEEIGKEKSKTLRIGAIGCNLDFLYCASRDAIQVWKYFAISCWTIYNCM